MEDNSIPYVEDVYLIDGKISFSINDWDATKFVVFVESKIHARRVLTPDEEGRVDERYVIPELVAEDKKSIDIIFVEVKTNEYLVKYSFEF